MQFLKNQRQSDHGTILAAADEGLSEPSSKCASVEQIPVGTCLGPYEVLAAIGAGGMAKVYRACDNRLGRHVALKVLPAAVAHDEERRRFEREARILASLNHPNILVVYDVGTHNDTAYIVTELVDGRSLRGLRLGVRKTVDAAIQIADGLAAAHAAGIVHRDLKPDNILLTRDGRIKIVDFGVAKTNFMSANQCGYGIETITRENIVVGTVGYMSPEQVRGLPADHRSDIFSFGVTLHEILRGQQVFRGNTRAEVMAAILRDDPPELPDIVPLPIRQIVAYCLEKDPMNRFESARDLSLALTVFSATTTPGLRKPA